MHTREVSSIHLLIIVLVVLVPARLVFLLVKVAEEPAGDFELVLVDAVELLPAFEGEAAVAASVAPVFHVQVDGGEDVVHLGHDGCDAFVVCRLDELLGRLDRRVVVAAASRLDQLALQFANVLAAVLGQRYRVRVGPAQGAGAVKVPAVLELFAPRVTREGELCVFQWVSGCSASVSAPRPGTEENPQLIVISSPGRMSLYATTSMVRVRGENR